MNGRLDFRDLLQLWCDDLPPLRGPAASSADFLILLLPSPVPFCVVESLRPSLAPASSFYGPGLLFMEGNRSSRELRLAKFRRFKKIKKAWSTGLDKPKAKIKRKPIASRMNRFNLLCPSVGQCEKMRDLSSEFHFFT